MSNLTPEDVNLRLTETRNELQLEDTRLWQGLEDEKVSRIAGDAANANQIQLTNTALAAQESRLSVEVVQREEGDLRNISSLTELAQALAAYRIKTDLEINNEKIARQQLGVDLNYRIDMFTATFDHQFLMVYQAIQDYQNDTDSTLSLFDNRITRYEQMLQDITTDSIQITMDNGEINMGAWTILSQARQWDLEILGKFKDYQTTTDQSIDEALQNIQNQLPLEEDIINKAIDALSQAPIILELDSKLNASIEDIDTIHADLLAEITNRQNEMITYSQTVSNQMQTNQAALVSMVEAESAARIDELQREASIRQQELVNEAIERSAEIDEKLQDALGNLNVDLSGVYSEINQVSAALDAEEAARITAITDLNNGLTRETQLRQDGDAANLAAINNYKTANDTALANVRSELQTNVTATTANASNITALDARLLANEGLAASAVNKAETALTQNSAMASEITSVKASITDIEDSLVDKADANALQLLGSKVTVLDGKVTTNTSDITQLKTNVTTLTNTKADSTALNALTSTVTTQGNTITSQSKDISDLTAAISTSVPEIKFTGTQDCINITAAFASNPDVILVTEPSAVSGKVVRIGNNSGNDQFIGIMNSYVAIDPTKLYRVKYRIRRVLNDAASIYLALVQTNATKTFNVMSSNTTMPLTDISNSLYYVSNAKPALNTWLTGEYYFKGKSAGASSGAGTLASPRTFSADAAFFRIGILSNYPAASGTQDVDYIIVEDYDAMALGNANAAATTALTARVTSAEGTLTSNSTAITQLQNSLTTTNNTVATKADASAVNTLDSKVTTMGSTVTSNSNAITQLQNDLTATNAAVSTKASAAALTALDTKVTTVDGKVTTQSSKITELNSSLTVTDKLTRLTSQGKPLRDDANFKTGANLTIYLAQTGYTLTRQTITAGNPSGSTHEYRMSMTQAITGNGIGFYPSPSGIASAANKVFLFKMVLKAPTGSVINIYKNATGTPTTYEMLGNNLGTGKFETYYFWLQCGPTGTFSTTGQVAITQGTATVGTVSTPFEVTVASYEVWDVTTVDDSIPKIWADKVDANATAVTSLNSQVTSINGTVTSQGSQLTTLTNRVSTVEGSVTNKADSSAVSSLDSKVTTIDGKVTQNANAITTLTGRVTTVENGLTNKADTSVLVNYSTKTETNTAIATGIQNYNASLVIGGTNLFSLVELKSYVDGNLSNVVPYVTVTGSTLAMVNQGLNSNLPGNLIPVDYTKDIIVSWYPIGSYSGHKIYYATQDASGNVVVGQRSKSESQGADGRVVITIPNSELSSTVTHLRLGLGSVNNTTYSIKDVQVEQGTKVTAWSPSPRDTQAALNTNASAIQTVTAEVSRINGEVVSTANNVNTLTSSVGLLQGSINEVRQTVTNNQESTNTLVTSLRSGMADADDVSMMMRNAAVVFEDLSFKNGWNGVQVYNNYGNGALVANFTDKLPDNPVASTRQLQFIHSGGATTLELGGFYQAVQSRANGVFLVKFVAKLPVGYSFGLYSNAIGDSASSYFIGSSEGTGKYKTYYGVYRCGATGTFSTLGFVAVNGQQPTPKNPLIWHLASSTVYDCLDSKVAPDSVVNGIAEAKTIASTAVNKSDAAAILAQNLQASLDSTNANIATNYYTKSSTDQAIAFASNQLSSSFNTAINNVGLINDTRYDNQPPSWYWAYYPKRTAKEFKNSYNIGISQATVDSLGVLETVVPWVDPSGGPIQQRFTWADSAYALTRYSISNSSWSAWASALNEVKTAVDRKLDASVISNYYTKAEADNVVAGKVEQFSSSMAVGGANLWSVVEATHISELGSHSVAVIREDEEELYIAINSLTNGVSLIRFDSCLVDQNTQFIVGEDVVLSFEVSGSGYYRLGVVYAYVGNLGSAIFTPNIVTDPSVWQRVEYKFKASGVRVNVANQLLGFRLDSADGWNTGAALKLRHVQLQRGKTATAFSKAPAITRAAVKEATQTVNGIQAIKTVSIDNNGFISGYGLISQLVNGVVQSAFGVNADYFYVGTSTSNQKKPFMVLTSPQTIGGVTYPAGTWMDVALIANATIGTAHIADASITNAKIASLDAGKITTGTLDANRIGANTITAEKLIIGDTTNLWGNQYFDMKGARPMSSSGRSRWNDGISQLKGMGVQLWGRDHIAPYSTRIPLKPGDTFVIEYTGGRNAGPANPLGVGLWVYDGNGSIGSSPFQYGLPTVIADLGSGWYRYRRTFKVWDNGSGLSAAYGCLYFQIEQGEYDSNPAYWTVGDVVVKKAMGGELIVNGAITAEKISVNSLSAVSATIGTLRTKTSGSRLEIRDDIIEVFDANGVVRVQLGIF